MGKERQPKLFDQSETGTWVSQPGNLKKSEEIPDRKVPQSGEKPMFSKEEIEKLYEGETPHTDRGYN